MLAPRYFPVFAALGSLALIIAAWWYQAHGYAPCHLCLLQRWPHYIAIGLGAIFFVVPNKWLARLGAALMLIGAGLALYHTGVEYGWWQGPSSCSGALDLNVSAEELLTQIETAPVVRCGEVTWQFLGLSMAAWNGICSGLLALLWWRGGQNPR